jgi:hypothetical protein
MKLEKIETHSRISNSKCTYFLDEKEKRQGIYTIYNTSTKCATIRNYKNDVLEGFCLYNDSYAMDPKITYGLVFNKQGIIFGQNKQEAKVRYIERIFNIKLVY